MKETSKAMNRRALDTSLPWKDIFKGKGLDIGSGDDLLPGAQPFDKEHGDANRILDYLDPESYDYVHASHVLEHVFNPLQCLIDWSKLIKPNGHLVGEIPSWELYEGRRETSIWNPDHKTTFSMWALKGGNLLPHFHAPSFFDRAASKARMKVLAVRLIDTNYDYCIGASVDQTFDFSKGVECYIEFCLQKLK